MRVDVISEINLECFGGNEMDLLLFPHAESPIGSD